MQIPIRRALNAFPWEFRVPNHVRSDPERIAALASSLPFRLDVDAGPWVAGGFVVRSILGEPQADVDVFCATEGQIASVEAAILRVGGVEVGGGSAFGRRRFALLTLRIDLVRTAAPIELHAERFDFSVCSLATDGATVVGPVEAFADAFGMRLRFRRQTTPERARKYVRLGLAPEVGSVEEFARLVRGAPVHGLTSDSLTREEALGLRPVHLLPRAFR